MDEPPFYWCVGLHPTSCSKTSGGRRGGKGRGRREGSCWCVCSVWEGGGRPLDGGVWHMPPLLPHPLPGPSSVKGAQEVGQVGVAVSPMYPPKWRRTHTYNTKLWRAFLTVWTPNQSPPDTQLRQPGETLVQQLAVGWGCKLWQPG